MVTERQVTFDYSSGVDDVIVLQKCDDKKNHHESEA